MRTSILLVAALLVGCSSEPKTTAAAGPPTFHGEVEAILQKSCQSCHVGGSGSAFSLASYADAKPYAAAIARETTARRMPPWGAIPTDECTPPASLVGDLRLTPEAIATLAAWSAAGAPEGDPAEAPPPLTHPSQHLAKVDLTLAPSAPFAPSDTDAYRCFVLDPQLANDVYVDGFEVLPGNASIVHHTVVYLDPDRASLALAGSDGSYSCFGGPRVANPGLLGAWAPGTDPMDLTADLGTLIKAHSLVVMQVHYHPHGTNLTPDTTKLALRFHPSKPALLLNNVLLGNAAEPRPGGDGLLPGPDDRGEVEFRIPANTAGHVERMRFTLNFPIPSIRLYGAGTHMHRAGVDMKIDRVRTVGGEESRQCLLQTPQWDFNWQRIYHYDTTLDALPTINAGDTIELRCTYDNTMTNPALVEQLSEQHLKAPLDILLGESTLDEMCVGYLPLVYPNQ